MKIYFLENVQSFGGARKATIELAQRLQTKHAVEIIDIHGCCEPFVQTCHEVGLQLWVVDPKGKQIILSSGNVWKRLWNSFKFLKHALRINRLLSKRLSQEDECLVVVNNSKVLSYLFFRPKNVKIALFARGWFLPQQMSTKDRFLYKRLVDKYMCVSEATRYAVHSAKLASLERINVVQNAIDVKQFEKVKPIENEGKELKILLSGGFLPTKGQNVAIEIAKRLKEKNLDFKMILTGIIYKGDVSEKFCQHIQQRIADEHLEDKVSVVVGKNDVRDYFKWCDIFVHPSDTEGLPRVVMEAMACKKAVIANAVGGVTDYVLHGFTGFLTRHNNVDDYVEYITLLNENRDLFEKISTNGYNLVANCFTSEQQIEQMNKALEL